MLKALLLFFLTSSVVFSGGQHDSTTEEHDTKGIANSSSNSAHSLYRKSISCKKANQWNQNYLQLEQNGAPLPEIFKNFEEKDGQKDCDIFFKNLFILDLKLYQNTSLLVRSFIELVEALDQTNIRPLFDISQSSFAYEPSTRRYVFIDIDKLELKIEDEDSPFNNQFPEELVIRFLLSLEKEKLILTTSDLEDLFSLSSNLNIIPPDLVVNDNVRTITLLDKIDLGKSPESDSTLIVSTIDRGFKIDLTVVFGNNVVEFEYIRDIDTFTIYLCKTASNDFDIECSDFFEKGINPIGAQQHRIRNDQRVDIEVLESVAQYNNLIKNKNQSFYEIFIIVKSKDSPGIAQSTAFFNSKKQLNIQDDDLILCETITNELIVLYNLNTNPSTKTYSMDYKALQIVNSNEIVQISPYHLNNQVPTNPEQIKRIFYLSQAAKKSIFTLDESEKLLKMISIEKFEVGPEPLFLKECEDTTIDLTFSADPNNRELKFGSLRKKYPSPIIFMRNYVSTSKVDKFCFKENKEGVSILSLDKKIMTFKSFEWNFNSYYQPEQSTSNQNIVYFKDIPYVPDFGLRSKNFKWPIAKPYSVFISIFKKTFDDYFTRAVFYDEKYTLYNINYNKKTHLKTKKVPKSLTCDIENSLFKNDDVTLSFSQFDAVYQAEREVVYQLDIPNFKDCHPILKFNKIERNIQIHCQYWVKEKSNPILPGSEKLTEGLERVTTQVKPIILADNKNSNDLKISKEKVNQVII